MRYLYCKYDMVTIEESFRRDNWDGINHYSKENHEFTISNKTPDDCDYGSFISQIPDDGVCVIVIYSTGGTFCRDDGEIHYVGCFKNEDALKIEMIINRSFNYSKTKEYVKDLKKHGITYCPWVGYFEHLESVVLVS